MDTSTLIKYFSINNEGDDYVVGDIHGCYTLLYAELAKIDFNFTTDRLFCVGDLVDRGLESVDVLDTIDKPWFHSVLGNHDLMAIEWLDGGASSFELYRQNGGQWFIDLDAETQSIIVEKFKKLPILIEIETKSGIVGIVHADCPVSSWAYLKEMILSGNRNALTSCIWSRDRIRHGDPTIIKDIDRLYHGHTVLKQRIALGNRNYIDTGAVFGYKLTIEKL